MCWCSEPTRAGSQLRLSRPRKTPWTTPEGLSRFFFCPLVKKPPSSKPDDQFRSIHLLISSAAVWLDVTSCVSSSPGSLRTSFCTHLRPLSQGRFTKNNSGPDLGRTDDVKCEAKIVSRCSLNKNVSFNFCFFDFIFRFSRWSSPWFSAAGSGTALGCTSSGTSQSRSYSTHRLCFLIATIKSKKKRLSFFVFSFRLENTGCSFFKKRKKKNNTGEFNCSQS